jgi:hypothetical protein
VDPLFSWIESSELSQWVRGSDCICAFPTIVTLHNIGMAAATGILLLIGYPTKALTNPLFYIKLSLVTVALGLLYRIVTDILPVFEVEQKSVTANAKVLAVTSLAAWAVLIAAGRFLAYTHKWEMLGVPAVL